MEWLAYVAGAGAALAAAGYLFRQTRAFFRIIDKAAALLEHELTNNGGASMKDNLEAAAADLHGIAVAIGKLQRAVAVNSGRLERLEGNLNDDCL